MLSVIFLGIFLLGLVIGSFLNVVILRLEKSETLGGRSYCPHCKHTLAWMDLIPVVSFLMLWGKCRYCSGPISWQYPLVEMITGILFLLIFNSQVSVISQLSIDQIIKVIFLLYITASFVVIFVYDVRHYLIPDSVLFPAIGVALGYRLLDWILFHQSIVGPLIGAAAACGFFLAIFLVSRGAWMGFGDVKLAILLGLLLSFPMILMGLFLSFLFGAVIGSVLMALDKKGLKSQMPFAPFLVAGTMVAFFWGQPLMNWYSHLFF